jgi:poly(3-hydroxybutyrate) depolymerase
MPPLRLAGGDAGLSFWQARPTRCPHYGPVVCRLARVFERLTAMAKPAFSITDDHGEEPVGQRTVALEKPFCRLLNFRKQRPAGRRAKAEHKLLIVAPMSGHYPTLLRGTVEAMLPHYDIYITDWIDARTVPLSHGTFDLDDYVDYTLEMLRLMGPGTSVMAVCQPSVPVLAAVALMNEDKDKAAPKTMILMGGPIDTRRNPTAVNKLAEQRGSDWFRQNAIMKVPFPHAGAMRDVYPGFLQLGGFMTMNLDRHVDAHRELYWHLVEGDGDSAEKHREFYDEYMSVMDLADSICRQSRRCSSITICHAAPSYMESPHRSGESPYADDHRGERDDISGVARPKRHTTFARLCRRKRNYTICRSMWAITACSTARASAPRWCRKSSSS